MKHNLTELDQFFDAARNGKPLMDDDAFASIIQNADIAPTEVIKQSPTSRIVSAFKHQGGMTMTGLGLTALSGILVTGYYLNTEAPAIKEPSQQAAVATVAPAVEAAPAAIEHKTSKAEAVPTQIAKPVYALANVKIIEPNEPTPFRPVLSADSLWARMTPESIKPIEITAKEVEELGINDGGQGKVYVVHALSSNGPKIRMAFPPEGMMLQIGEPQDEAVTQTTHQLRNNNAAVPPERSTHTESSIKSTDRLAPIMPTMVTDAKGKKLAFFFKAGKKANGFDVQSMSLSQRSGDDTEIPMPMDGAAMSIGTNSMSINSMKITQDGGIVIGGDTDDDDVAIDIDDDLDLDLDDDVAMKKEYELKVDGGNPEITKLRKMAQGMKLSVQTDLDSAMSRNGGHGMRMMMSSTNDSLFDGKMNFNFDFKLDSSNLVLNAQATREKMQGLENKAVQLRLNVDSIRTFVMKHLQDTNMQKFVKRSIVVGKQFMRSNGIDSVQGLDDLRQLHIQRDELHSLNELREVELPDIRVQLDRINKLIPVRIKAIDPSAENNQDGLIFWYARDARFAEKAPASLVEKIDKLQEPAVTDNAKTPKASISKVSAVSDPMVYPNPSPGRTMFKYTLAEPRAISIAIHDLLGKQVMKVTGLEMKSAGTFEKELDLSSLDAGVYLLIMVTDAGEQITQRVVIEK
jgi:hypothetical protein